MGVEQLRQPPTGFHREMLDPAHILVKSTCDFCGFKVVGSFLETLLTEELAHRTKCVSPISRDEGAA